MGHQFTSPQCIFCIPSSFNFFLGPAEYVFGGVWKARLFEYNYIGNRISDTSPGDRSELSWRSLRDLKDIVWSPIRSSCDNLGLAAFGPSTRYLNLTHHPRPSIPSSTSYTTPGRRSSIVVFSLIMGYFESSGIEKNGNDKARNK